ncbi:uncharacterized protein LACBIDRAFT_335057 [Laccaria bicolor S238N-H82]|uniref:Predicted protein n=1 Tax=Laccaria bicolor (strain S238N-H82 / ATCC MYA-4686) TaxID=486041 RepID=B0E181_LACBS|nr:uncharacterized protein LACBIDRAFT_335057 [Laccaria bicolor S238N-H82]EDQ99413.1 predicted protein [Laccaria bicolor S238N-H82]|eukprot:XP_001889964.1 predicted protein [Laccaria bicolor S238N-H82]
MLIPLLTTEGPTNAGAKASSGLQRATTSNRNSRCNEPPYVNFLVTIHAKLSSIFFGVIVADVDTTSHHQRTCRCGRYSSGLLYACQLQSQEEFAFQLSTCMMRRSFAYSCRQIGIPLGLRSVFDILHFLLHQPAGLEENKRARETFEYGGAGPSIESPLLPILRPFSVGPTKKVFCAHFATWEGIMHQGPDSNSSAILLLFIIQLPSSSLPLSSSFAKNYSANMSSSFVFLLRLFQVETLLLEKSSTSLCLRRSSEGHALTKEIFLGFLNFVSDVPRSGERYKATYHITSVDHAWSPIPTSCGPSLYMPSLYL